MRDDRVISLAERANDGRMETPEQLLERILDRIRAGEVPAKKAVILLLDDSDVQYDAYWAIAGMFLSEAVALCEFGKASMMREMVDE